MFASLYRFTDEADAADDFGAQTERRADAADDFGAQTGFLSTNDEAPVSCCPVALRGGFDFGALTLIAAQITNCLYATALAAR